LFRNAAVQHVLEAYKPVWALDHVSSLLEWDLETYMPSDASKSRGLAQAHMVRLKQSHILGMAGLVSEARCQNDLSDFEKGILRAIGRDMDYYARVPPQLLEKLQKATTEARVVWREARRKSDFQMFKGHLESIVDLKRQEAEKLGYAGHPYNAILDRFEEGSTTDDVDKVFSALVPELKRILTRVLSDGKFLSRPPLEDAEYEENDMRCVNQEILALMEMPKGTFRMDVSTHPFATHIAIKDVRVTTRYEGIGFKESMYSLIHECGHALYELQIDPAFEYTPLARIISLGVDESQSRFWENFIGRSREFIRLVYPILDKHLQLVQGCSFDDLYIYLNTVKPSLIRVEADELTYNFHIVLRYELEKRLIAGDLSVSEVPALWADMMEKYVGVRPRSDAQGALQDGQWSGGMFGFFGYSLGNIIAGMIYDKIRKEMDFEQLVGKGAFQTIKDWLKENIHKWGNTYSAKELQRRIFNETYNPTHLVNYLEQKYLR